MANSVRGNGLFDAHDALAALVANPALLDRARRRFSDSPPPYSPEPDEQGESTQPESPSNDVRPTHEQRRIDLEGRYRQSYPEQQFNCQTVFLAKRAAQHRYGFAPEEGHYTGLLEEMKDIVRKHWKEQGIWRDKWGKEPSMWNEDQWRHEEPEHAPGFNNPQALFGDTAASTRPPLVPTETSEEKRERQRLRDASRPYHQFLWQVSKEREWLLGNTRELDAPPKPYKPLLMRTFRTREDFEAAARAEDDPPPKPKPDIEPSLETPPDISTMAYEAVKARWMKWLLWDHRWGILPGMLWIHEEPLDDFVRREMADDPDYVQPEPEQDSGAVVNHENNNQAPRPFELFSDVPQGAGRSLFGNLPLSQESNEQAEDRVNEPAPQGVGRAWGRGIFGLSASQQSNGEEEHRENDQTIPARSFTTPPSVSSAQPDRRLFHVDPERANERETTEEQQPSEGLEEAEGQESPEAGVKDIEVPPHDDPLPDKLPTPDTDTPQSPPKKRGRPRGRGRPKLSRSLGRERRAQVAVEEAEEAESAPPAILTRAQKTKAAKPPKLANAGGQRKSQPADPLVAQQTEKDDAAAEQATPRRSSRIRNAANKESTPKAVKLATVEEEEPFTASPRQKRTKGGGRTATKRRRVT